MTNYRSWTSRALWPTISTSNLIVPHTAADQSDPRGRKRKLVKCCCSRSWTILPRTSRAHAPPAARPVCLSGIGLGLRHRNLDRHVRAAASQSQLNNRCMSLWIYNRWAFGPWEAGVGNRALGSRTRVSFYLKCREYNDRTFCSYLEVPWFVSHILYLIVWIFRTLANYVFLECGFDTIRPASKIS